MTVSLIVAAAANQAIGKNGQLLWHLPNDLRFFKNTTWGMVVLMGRKTFESVNKPLPGRINIVVTRDAAWQADGTITATSLADGLEKATATHCKEVFIIGGGELYRQSMDMATTVYLTRVHTELEGDTFFPELPAAEWTLYSNEDFTTDDKHAWPYSFQVWKRKTLTA